MYVWLVLLHFEEEEQHSLYKHIVQVVEHLNIREETFKSSCLKKRNSGIQKIVQSRIRQQKSLVLWFPGSRLWNYQLRYAFLTSWLVYHKEGEYEETKNLDCSFCKFLSIA